MYTIEDLKNINVPEGLISYNLIHENIISKLKTFTEEESFVEKIDMSKKGDMACATICSPKIGLGIHWSYSYSRTLRFQLSIVAYGKATGLIYTTDDVQVHTFPKTSVHTTEHLNEAIENCFAELLDGVSKQKLISFRKTLLEKEISYRAAYIHAADLYFDQKFLSPTQLSAYQTELEQLKEIDGFTLWNNAVCMIKVLADSNPKNWLKDNRELSVIFKNKVNNTATTEQYKVSKMTEGIVPEDLTGNVKIISPEESKEILEKNEALEELHTEQVIDDDTILVLDAAPDYDERSICVHPDVHEFDKKENIENHNEEEKSNSKEISITVEEQKPVKKGLGLFASIAKQIVSENTGKTKNVIVSTPISEEQIEVIIEEREQKARANIFVSDELTDEESIQEIFEEINENIQEDNSELIDEFDIPTADDFESDDFDIIESAEQSETIDDFGIEETKSETDYKLINYGEGNEPDSVVKLKSATCYKFNSKNLSVVINN